MSLLLALTGGSGGATVTATAAVPLGALNVAAAATPTVTATAAITCGTATVTATATVTHSATAAVPLGALTVTATGPNATPPDDGGSSHSAGGYPKARLFPEPPRLPRIPNTAHATTSVALGALTVHAVAVASYSWEHADEELLLLLTH